VVQGDLNAGDLHAHGNNSDGKRGKGGWVRVWDKKKKKKKKKTRGFGSEGIVRKGGSPKCVPEKKKVHEDREVVADSEGKGDERRPYPAFLAWESLGRSGGKDLT